MTTVRGQNIGLYSFRETKLGFDGGVGQVWGTFLGCLWDVLGSVYGMFGGRCWDISGAMLESV